jgi:hypothetical protein
MQKPMSTSVINEVNLLGQRQQQPKINKGGFMFEWVPSVPIIDEIDDADEYDNDYSDHNDADDDDFDDFHLDPTEAQQLANDIIQA